MSEKNEWMSEWLNESARNRIYAVHHFQAKRIIQSIDNTFNRINIKKLIGT